VTQLSSLEPDCFLPSFSFIWWFGSISFWWGSYSNKCRTHAFTVDYIFNMLGSLGIVRFKDPVSLQLVVPVWRETSTIVRFVVKKWIGCYCFCQEECGLLTIVEAWSDISRLWRQPGIWTAGDCFYVTWHGAHFVFSEAKVNDATALSSRQAYLSSSYPVGGSIVEIIFWIWML
jgi:hypothetical protein